MPSASVLSLSQQIPLWRQVFTTVMAAVAVGYEVNLQTFFAAALKPSLTLVELLSGKSLTSAAYMKTIGLIMY